MRKNSDTGVCEPEIVARVCEILVQLRELSPHWGGWELHNQEKRSQNSSVRFGIVCVLP